jgi:DNA gyrase subunit A
VKTAEVTAKTGKIIGAKVVVATADGLRGAGEAEEVADEVVVISKKGQVIRTSISEIPALSRATQGVRIMKMREGDAIASMAAL